MQFKIFCYYDSKITILSNIFSCASIIIKNITVISDMIEFEN